MVAMLAFHETKKGTVTPVVGHKQPTYGVLATLRLPDGRSVPLDNAVRVEHLVPHDHRPRPDVQGRRPGHLEAGLEVPPQLPRRQGRRQEVRCRRSTSASRRSSARPCPQADDHANRQVQRVPFDVAGRTAAARPRLRLVGAHHQLVRQGRSGTRGGPAARSRPYPSAAATRPGAARRPAGRLTPDFGPEPPPDPRRRPARSPTPAAACAYVAKVARRRRRAAAARRLDGEDHSPGPARSRSSSRASAATRCTPAGRSGPATRWR